MPLSAQHVAVKLSYGQAISLCKQNYENVEDPTDIMMANQRDHWPHVRAEVNYLFRNQIDAGLYFGYSSLLQIDKTNTEFLQVNEAGLEKWYSGHQIVVTNSFFYGCTVNYHLLPLLKNPPSNLDVYATASLGLVTDTWYPNKMQHDSVVTSEIYHTKTSFEAGAGLGVAFFFTRHFALFGEFLGGKFLNRYYNWRAGLLLKI